MENHFWSNTIWYCLLGLSTTIELFVVLLKTKRRKFILAFYLTLTGITLSFETLLFIILRAYYYYPMIIPTSSFDDALAGNLFSQFSLGASALLVSVLNLNNGWIVILAGIYGGIEELFLSLGIYKHYWYETWMTVIMITIFFPWAKKYYLKNLNGITPIEYYFNIFIGLFSLDVVTILWGFMLSGNQTYTKCFFPDSLGSPYIMAVMYYSFISVILMAIYFLKLRWYWKGTVFFGLYGIDYLAYRMNIFYIKNGWFLIFSTTTILSMYVSIILLDYLYTNKKSH